MVITDTPYKVELHPGTVESNSFFKLCAEQNLHDWFDEQEWMIKQGVTLGSKWMNTHYITVLEFDSESAWWEFRMRWL